jgi:F0F1-type ATP synthase delta subunit
VKQPRSKISNYIAETSLKDGVSKKLGKEIAAYLLYENRTSDLDSILRDVRQNWADNGQVEVIAVSAFKLSDKVIIDIKKQISKLYPNAKKIIVTEQHDPSVIAGVRLELANQQLDLTVLSKLNKFKQLSVS